MPIILAACENPVENRATAPGPISATVVVSNLSFNQTVVGINDCTEEAFNVQGIFHILVTVTDDHVGGFHSTFHVDWADLKLINTATGETFVTNQSLNFSVESKAAQPVNEELTFTLAGPGGQTVTNEVAHIRFQYVVNANGTLTVSGFDFQTPVTDGRPPRDRRIEPSAAANHGKGYELVELDRDGCVLRTDSAFPRGNDELDWESRR